MKKIFIIATVLIFLSSTAAAFLYEVQVMSAEEIKSLKDSALIDLYTQALIEREASEAFHGKAGFTPKEYKSFKELLGLIVRIRKELANRSVEVPPIDQWLN